MSDRKTFCAFGAYAVNVVDPSATVLMLLVDAGEQVKEITNDKLVTLDLSKRLGKVAWEDVVMDNVGLNRDGTPKTGFQGLRRPENEDGINVHTVGPTFLGPHIGGIYMERSRFFAEIRRRLDPTLLKWPYEGWHTYQIMTSASRTDKEISRYHGFHGTVIESAGSTKKLLIKRWDGQGSVTVTVDLNDRAQCDDPALLTNEVQDPDRREREVENPGRPEVEHSVLDAASNPAAEGAIFLALGTCAALNLSGPKEPPGGGG